MENSNQDQLKGSENFKNVIKKHLDDYCKVDKLFKESYCKKDKCLDDCIQFIIQKVMKSGANGFPDEEIFQLARHYYDEDDIKIDKPITNVEIIVNNQIGLSNEEINSAKKEAIDQIIRSEKKKLQTKNERVIKKNNNQKTLF